MIGWNKEQQLRQITRAWRSASRLILGRIRNLFWTMNKHNDMGQTVWHLQLWHFNIFVGRAMRTSQLDSWSLGQNDVCMCILIHYFWTCRVLGQTFDLEICAQARSSKLSASVSWHQAVFRVTTEMVKYSPSYSPHWSWHVFYMYHLCSKKVMRWCFDAFWLGETTIDWASRSVRPTRQGSSPMDLSTPFFPDRHRHLVYFLFIKSSLIWFYCLCLNVFDHFSQTFLLWGGDGGVPWQGTRAQTLARWCRRFNVDGLWHLSLINLFFFRSPIHQQFVMLKKWINTLTWHRCSHTTHQLTEL